MRSCGCGTTRRGQTYAARGLNHRYIRKTMDAPRIAGRARPKFMRLLAPAMVKFDAAEFGKKPFYAGAWSWRDGQGICQQMPPATALAAMLEQGTHLPIRIGWGPYLLAEALARDCAAPLATGGPAPEGYVFKPDAPWAEIIATGVKHGHITLEGDCQSAMLGLSHSRCPSPFKPESADPRNSSTRRPGACLRSPEPRHASRPARRKEHSMRIEAQSKMGYYPTPETSLHRIITWLSLSGDGLRRYLDPCAGKGEALAAIATAHGPAETYGIELSDLRAAAAKQILNHVINTGYEYAVLTDETFSLALTQPAV